MALGGIAGRVKAWPGRNWRDRCRSGRVSVARIHGQKRAPNPQPDPRSLLAIAVSLTRLLRPDPEIPASLCKMPGFRGLSKYFRTAPHLAGVPDHKHLLFPGNGCLAHFSFRTGVKTALRETGNGYRLDADTWRRPRDVRPRKFTATAAACAGSRPCKADNGTDPVRPHSRLADRRREATYSRRPRPRPSPD